MLTQEMLRRWEASPPEFIFNFFPLLARALSIMLRFAATILLVQLIVVQREDCGRLKFV